MIITAVLFGAVWAWTYVIARRRAGLPLLEQEPIAPVPWTILDAVLMLVLLFLINSALYMAAVRSGALPATLSANAPPDQMATTIFLFSLSCLAALIITLMLVPLRTGATYRQLGFDNRTIARDISIGVTAFFILVVPVLLTQLILTLLWKETSHPLVGLLSDDPSAKFFAM